MAIERLELKLDMESVQALRDLAQDMQTIIGDMEESDSKLIRSFEEVWDNLGLHAAAIQDLIFAATAVEREAREAVEALPPMMIRTADKIETHVRHLRT